MARILVADDEPDVLDLVRIGLQSAGHDVLGAHDGSQAVSLAFNDSFDLLVLDVMMPHLSGLDVVTEVRSNPDLEQPAILMLSALSSRADIRAGYLAGADDYLPKPFSITELIDRVGMLLDERQLKLT